MGLSRLVLPFIQRSKRPFLGCSIWSTETHWTSANS